MGKERKENSYKIKWKMKKGEKDDREGKDEDARGAISKNSVETFLTFVAR